MLAAVDDEELAGDAFGAGEKNDGGQHLAWQTADVYGVNE